MKKTIIDMHGIVKSFYIGTPNELEILHGINITVKEGEFVSIVGQSGSGKSTLMNIIGAPIGVETVAEAHPDVKIYVSTLDRQLNDVGYILPGLGDAGDRLFGTK